MRKTILKRLMCENGNIFAITKNGERLLFAKCEPIVEIYECSEKLQMMGGNGIKRYYVSIILCDKLNFTRDADDAFFRNTVRFEMFAELQRKDGVFEKRFFGSLSAPEIEPDGKWIFEVNERPDTVLELIDYV